MNLRDIFPKGFEFTFENGRLINLRPATVTSKDSELHTKNLERYFQQEIDSLSMYEIAFESGTELQQRVWKELMKLKRGEVVSYEELANRVGTKAVRAVATAVGRNPIPVIIPCHRIVRKDGSIGKYSMGGSEVKRALLALEGISV